MKNNSNSLSLRMNNTNDMINNMCLIVLVVLVFVSALSQDKKLKKIANQLTDGKINTLLILVIVALIMTENLQVGFYYLLYIQFYYTDSITIKKVSNLDHHH